MKGLVLVALVAGTSAYLTGQAQVDQCNTISCPKCAKRRWNGQWVCKTWGRGKCRRKDTTRKPTIWCKKIQSRVNNAQCTYIENRFAERTTYNPVKLTKIPCPNYADAAFAESCMMRCQERQENPNRKPLNGVTVFPDPSSPWDGMCYCYCLETPQCEEDWYWASHGHSAICIKPHLTDPCTSCTNYPASPECSDPCTVNC